MAPTVGLGFKPQHFEAAASCAAVGQWYEVHPENYMVAGGPRPAMLEALRERRPLSLHGVGLSLASDAPPDAAHLARLRAMVDRYEPFVVSEHLAWSVWRGAYAPDLLPFPRTGAALRRIADNIDRTQAALGRAVLIENPSLYLDLDGHEFSETEFLAELVRRTGCGLLVDVNNVFVSASNLGFDAHAYLDALPERPIGEIHVAGHTRDAHSTLLIDSHGAPVAEAVWSLYARLIARIGSRPTLIERDDDIPEFDDLMRERARAVSILSDAGAGAERMVALA